MKKVIATVVLMICPFLCHGADIQKIVADTQRMSNQPNNVTMVWWIPGEFWEIALKDNPRITAAQRAEFIKALEGYLIFAVASLDIGTFGGMTPKSRETILQKTELIIENKKRTPLTDSAISSDASNFISIMKPMMAKMLGQFGDGMEFIVYSNDGTESSIISASKKGSFSYVAFAARYEWKLPLVSLLSPKIDPKTKQSFPGDYIFNPYTGEKLLPE
jgi:hypothetical protein